MNAAWPPVPDYFDVAPVSLWLEDYRGLKLLFDGLRAQGVADLAAFLAEHPDWTVRCWDTVEVLRVNQRTLELFGAQSTAELLGHTQKILHTGDPKEATYPLLKFWHLQPGQNSFQVTAVNHKLCGQRLDARIGARILPGYEHDWSLVLSSIEDVTELRAQEAQFKAIADQVPGMLYRVRVPQQGKRELLFVSEGARDLFQVEPSAILADSGHIDCLVHPDDQARLYGAMGADHQRSTAPLQIDFRIVLHNGTLKWIRIVSTAEESDGLDIIRSGVMLDITEQKRAEEILRTSEGRWKQAMAATGDGMWEWRPETGTRLFPSGDKDLFGYSAEEFADFVPNFVQFIHPDDIAQRELDHQNYALGHSPVYTNEARIRCKDGSWRWVLSRGVSIGEAGLTGPAPHMIGVYTDISDRKRSEQVIWQQANFDPLTSLPNRRMLRDRLEQEILKGRRDGSQLALLFLDLDHFKEVNDTLGHEYGDQLLVEAARRIRECVRESDTVARLGGDEFTVLVPELSDTSQLERILQSTLQSLAAPFRLGHETVFVSGSIGITMYPQDATDVDTLLRNADQALYAAKGAGRNRFSFFTPALQEAAQQRVRLASDLRVALREHEFQVYYQPIVELASGAVYKAEALLRWRHPQRGFISPAEFIPIAETTGLIVRLGDWVFAQSAAQVRDWRAQLDARFQISVNRSPLQFQGQDAASNALSWPQHLAELGIPGAAVAVEITEGLLLDPSVRVAEQLLELSEHGIAVSLDDFGTGYSALSYLQRYDIDFIKIDQSFVRNLAPGSTDLVLCKAMIVMAHELGMKVVAEGVETEQQRDLLLAAGCDYAQGYWFARPMPVAEFEAFYQAQRR